MNLQEIKTKLGTFKEILWIIGAIIAGIFGAMWWLNDNLNEREKNRVLQDEKFIGALVERIDQDLNPLTTSEFLTVMNHRDSMDMAIMAQGTEYYIRHLVRQDSIMIALARLNQTDRDINAEIRRIEQLITGTAKHLQETQLTDSLQNELMRLRMEQRTLQILDEMERNHREQLKKIQEGKPPEYTSKTRRTPKGLKVMTHQKKVAK